MVLLQQEEEGGHVRQNIRQAEYDIEKRKFKQGKHPGKGKPFFNSVLFWNCLHNLQLFLVTKRSVLAFLSTWKTEQLQLSFNQ